MTILRHNLVSGSMDEPTMPRVGYANHFREGTVTASSEAVGHPAELAYSGFTYDAWLSTGGATESLQAQMGGSTAADYMALAAHNLEGATVTPQRSTSGSSWTDLHAGYVVPDNRPIVWEWPSVSDVYWRLLITSAPAAVSIGAIHVGEKLTLQRGLPVGWKPPSLNEDVQYTNVMSQGGQVLGRNIVRRGVTVDVQSNHAEYVWAREDWADFIEVAELYAFFFWWANEGKAEIVYGGLDSRDVSFSTEHLVAAKFSLMGITR
jgi:hypothetical protein